MPLNIALIGTGRIAENELLPALASHEDARLWSVLSRDAARAEDVAERFGAHAPQAAFTHLDDLLADPQLDAVLIATPDALHAEQTIAAARAGKHVLTEKPMATEAGDARAMVQACADAGVRLGVAYHMRWHAGHRALAAMAHRGEFGELRHMRLQWCRRHESDANWRAHPQVGRWWSLAGVGTHCVDQVAWFMGPSCGEITDVRSVINRAVWGSPHDETAVVALQFANGSTAEICTSVLFDAPRMMEVYGSTGHAICENTLGPGGDGDIRTSTGPLDYTPVNPYVAEIADFVAAVREGRDPEVSGAQGAQNVSILLAAVGEPWR
jgi:1,5-anhydro-D-fructose reductase (1,5-anhydro-D-mannitol-forming)